MVSYTIKIEDRELEALKLTREEAADMEAGGFRFAEFNLEQGRFRLSLPYQTVRELNRGTLTFMQ